MSLFIHGILQHLESEPWHYWLYFCSSCCLNFSFSSSSSLSATAAYETIVFLLLLLVVGLHDCWHLYGLVTASFWIPAVLVLFPFSFCIPLLMWLELPFFKEGKREDSTIAGLHSGFKDNLQLDKWTVPTLTQTALTFIQNFQIIGKFCGLE